MSGVRIRGTGSRRNVRPYRVQQRTVQFSYIFFIFILDSIHMKHFKQLI